MKKSILEVLQQNGYINQFSVQEEKGSPKKQIVVQLKYDPKTEKPVASCLKRISRPGLRQYTNVEEMPEVINGMGIAILSTSKGVMDDKNAKKQKVGGEVLCYVY